MTTDRALGPATPSRATLKTSLLLGFASIVCLKTANSNSILFALGICGLTASALPLLAAVRSKFSNKSYSESGRWMTAVTVLLWIALLIGPIVAGAVWIWTSLWEVDRFDELGAMLFAFFSFCASFGFALLAILIQLWRGQWRGKLTAATLAYLSLLFVAYVLEMSGII